MKIIEAVIKPAKLSEVKNTLARIGINGVGVSVAGGGEWKGQTGVYRGQSYSAGTASDVKIELAVDDERADAAVAAIVSAANKVRLTVTDVEELCHEEPHLGIYRGQEYLVETPTDSRIELVVDDTRADHEVAAMFAMTPGGLKMTVGDERELGRQTQQTGIYRGQKYSVSAPEKN